MVDVASVAVISPVQFAGYSFVFCAGKEAEHALVDRVEFAEAEAQHVVQVAVLRGAEQVAVGLEGRSGHHSKRAVAARCVVDAERVAQFVREGALPGDATQAVSPATCVTQPSAGAELRLVQDDDDLVVAGPFEVVARLLREIDRGLTPRGVSARSDPRRRRGGPARG